MESTIQYDEFGGTPRVICTDCKSWQYLSKGGVIRHSSRCDFPKAQREAPKVEESKHVVSPHMSANGKSTDELVEGVQKGYLSMSRAMNTDY